MGRLPVEQLEQTSGSSRAWAELRVSWPEWYRARQPWDEVPECCPLGTQSLGPLKHPSSRQGPLQALDPFFTSTQPHKPQLLGAKGMQALWFWLHGQICPQPSPEPGC